MKQLKRFLQILGCILSSIYLTYILAQNALTTKLQIGFAFIYFLVISGIILYCYENFLAKKITRKYDKKMIIISFLFTLLIIISNYNGILPKQYLDNQIIIEATGEKNIKSNGAEVWVTKISVDDKDINLPQIPLSPEWEYKSDSDTIFINASKDNKQPLSLNLPKGDKVEILFVKHGWSGIVNISDGSEISTIDLYDLNGSTYSYNISGRTYSLPNYLNNLLLLGCGILLYFLIIFCLKIILKNSKFSILIYLLFTFIVYKDIVVSNIEFISLLFCSSLISIINLTFQSNPLEIFNQLSNCDNKIKKYYSKSGEIGILLISFYSAFASIGYRLFLSSDYINITISKLAIFILCLIWFIPIIQVGLFLLELLSNKFNMNKKISNKTSSIKAAISIFLILFITWEVVLIGFFPANMTSDSIDQWAQAIGVYPIGNAHPAFDTIVIKLLTYIIESPFWVASVQIICMSAVCTCFFMLLYKKGVKLSLACTLALFYACLPNNFMLVTTLWKDIPYTISILWLTYLIGNILISPEKFFGKWINVILISISIIFVRFFRHNGIISYLLIVLFLIYVTIRYFKNVRFKPVYTLFIVISLTLLIDGPIFKLFNVQVGEQSKPYTTMFYALGSVINKNQKLSEETTETLISIMPLEDWKEYYNRFNCDSYGFWHEGGMDISSISAKQAFSAYFEGLIKYPDIIIKDRLDGMNLLWDVAQPIDSFNHRYADGMYFPSFVDPSIFNIELTDKDNLVYVSNNFITKIVSLIRSAIIKLPFSDILLFRSGIYIILYLILLLYSFKNKIYRVIWISLPFIGNTISWILLMAHQSYRYVYYVAPCVFGMCIIITTLQRSSSLVIDDY